MQSAGDTTFRHPRGNAPRSSLEYRTKHICSLDLDLERHVGRRYGSARSTPFTSAATSLCAQDHLPRRLWKRAERSADRQGRPRLCRRRLAARGVAASGCGCFRSLPLRAASWATFVSRSHPSRHHAHQEEHPELKYFSRYAARSPTDVKRRYTLAKEEYMSV